MEKLNHEIKNEHSSQGKRLVKAIGKESFIGLAVISGIFILMSSEMGMANMFKTMMNTAHDLLLNTVFSIMGIAVLSGAFSSILTEFGIISIINRLLSPLMKPVYSLPGAASVGVLTTFLSDNPAIISLAKDQGFVKYFKRYQIPALTNLGTSFGMGLIVATFMISQAPEGQSFIMPAVIGVIGACVGSIVSVRLMIRHTKKIYGTQLDAVTSEETSFDVMDQREIRDGGIFQRALEAMLDGGKSGVEMGLSIIPGVLIVCTMVMMLTNSSSDTGFTGAAYEGVGLLPVIGQKLDFIIRPLFGFSSPEAIAFPITSLGAVGAAISLVPKFLARGIIGANEIAVFTAMGMCWSGYLSTHVGMLDALGCRELTNKAIISHTAGGLVAGISANLLYNIAAFFLI